MTKCQSQSFPCYNKAEYIVKLRPTTFNKEFSNKIDKFKLCKQCHDLINPDNKNAVYLNRDESIEAFMNIMKEEGIIDFDEICDKYVTMRELGEVSGYMFTFRRLK